MKIVNRNVLLLVIGIMLVFLGGIGVNYLNYKKNNNGSMPHVNLQTKKDKHKNTFAIMLEQSDGTYKETTSTSFNYPGYTLNRSKSSCIDINGDKIANALSYNATTKAIGVTSNKTAYCYVFFDKHIDADELITTLASADEIAYDETADTNLRYIGANPNNYIYFNCSDYNNPTASTCEKWRIIGVFNNVENENGEAKTLIKIIRSESLGNYSWDYKQNGVGSSETDVYGSNDWEDSQLMLMLNGVSLENYKSGYRIFGNYLLDKNNISIMNISGSYYEGSTQTYIPANTTTDGYSNTTTVNFGNNGLKNDTTRNMIENVVWKLGGSNDATVSNFYSNERGTDVYSNRPTEWKGKIGLMYPSDYGYATSGGTTTDRETCLATELSYWDSSVSDCYDNDWLYTGSNEWSLTSFVTISNTVFYISADGNVQSHYAYGDTMVRPSVYLTSNIGINGGEGSSTSPYILKVA